MAGYKRLGRRGRHLIRQLRKSRHAAVQRTIVHELKSHVSGRHGYQYTSGPPDLGKPGRYRPLTRKAKQLLTRLRQARVWSVQKKIIAELEREIERGKRLAERIRKHRYVQRTRRAGRSLRRNGKAFRSWAQQVQERHLRRAERHQAGREAGRRRPPLAARMGRRSRETARSLRARVTRRRSRPAPQARPGRVPQPAGARTLRPAPRTRPARVPRARTPRPARTR